VSAQQIILDHDKWRKGIGGAPAGLSGESDSSAYAGLDLDLAEFSDATFSGGSFSDCTFRNARWSSCRFTRCTFSQCDFEHIAISGCTFVNCTFEKAQFANSQLAECQFTHGIWNHMNFDHGWWRAVKVLDCKGTTVNARHLRGEGVAFTGSSFEHLEFEDTLLNSTV